VAVSTWISVLDLYVFVLVDSLGMTLQCPNTYEFDTCHELYSMTYILLYFVECICQLIWWRVCALTDSSTALKVKAEPVNKLLVQLYVPTYKVSEL